MNKTMRTKIIELMTFIVAFIFLAGCISKTPNNTTHVESGDLTTIIDEIYNDCINNKDFEGAKEVLETHKYLLAFCCKHYTEVKYDDVKNKNYENIKFDIGDLQIAVAAYNEYNEESAMDVEVDWICHYNSCTKEQHDAIDAYVYWFGYSQNGNGQGPIKEYRGMVSTAYNEMMVKFNLPTETSFECLTPAQFKEVQNYMADPENYQVDTSLWE